MFALIYESAGTAGLVLVIAITVLGLRIIWCSRNVSHRTPRHAYGELISYSVAPGTLAAAP